ncbi:MAG TPA: sigma-54-dependent transcriptional regulator, partial [Candidatus Avalokitesvara rifleensis]|uniref:sigma-54-dependent transcriptional regulator n=1 Tax=Candidatus Avalokitesvara rifleensis TaxID=3367620 RepID=UPI0040297E34
ARDAHTALRTLEKGGFDIALLDVRMPQMNGVELLEKIKQEHQGIEVIIMTAYGTIETAIKSIKLGAYAYMLKPLDIDEMLTNIQKIVKLKALKDEARFLQWQLEEKHGYKNIIGNSGAIKRVVDTIKKVSASDSTVLTMGGSGTGKEMVSDAIHYSSRRYAKPYVKINCAAFPENLLESELFGYEKGAFTGADKQKKGKFEVADGGTLFLDEIGDMPLAMQAKLLRVLEKGEFERLGGNEVIKVNVRFIAATNQNLEKMLKEKHFRSDLFYRLNTVIIPLPSLVERKEDIPLLIGHFIEKFSTEMNKKAPKVVKEAMDLIMSYPWPGNVRELANAIERATIFCEDGVIKPSDLPPNIQAGHAEAPSAETSGDLTLEALEKRHISNTLKHTRGNKNEAARVLGIHRETLYKKIKKFNIENV